MAINKAPPTSTPTEAAFLYARLNKPPCGCQMSGREEKSSEIGTNLMVTFDYLHLIVSRVNKRTNRPFVSGCVVALINIQQTSRLVNLINSWRQTLMVAALSSNFKRVATLTRPRNDCLSIVGQFIKL